MRTYNHKIAGILALAFALGSSCTSNSTTTETKIPEACTFSNKVYNAFLDVYNFDVSYRFQLEERSPIIISLSSQDGETKLIFRSTEYLGFRPEDITFRLADDSFMTIRKVGWSKSSTTFSSDEETVEYAISKEQLKVLGKDDVVAFKVDDDYHNIDGKSKSAFVQLVKCYKEYLSEAESK